MRPSCCWIDGWNRPSWLAGTLIIFFAAAVLLCVFLVGATAAAKLVPVIYCLAVAAFVSL